MKKTIVLGLIGLVILASCDFFNPTQDNDDSKSSSTVDVIPNLGSSTASRLVIPEDTTYAKAVGTMLTPLLYNFEENDEGVGVGETFTESNEILDLDVTFAISEENGNIIYDGQNSDDTVRVYIEYDPENRTFDYTEILFFNDKDNVLGNEDPQKSVGYISYSDVSINEEDLSFNSIGQVVGLISNSDGSSISINATDKLEIYHGTLENGVTGTGVSMYKSSDPEGNSFDILPNSEYAPESIEQLKDLQQMSNYFDAVSIDKFMDGYEKATFAQIWIKDGSSITEIDSEQIDKTSVQSFVDSYPSTWGENSVRNN